MKEYVLKAPLSGLVALLALIGCTTPTPPPVTTASLSGIVFDDLNKNSAREAGELGLKDWTVYVDTNGNNALDVEIGRAHV